MHYIQPCGGAHWTQQGRSECKLARNRFVQNKLQHWAAWADNRKVGAKSEPCIGLTAYPLSAAPGVSSLCGKHSLRSLRLLASLLFVAHSVSTLCVWASPIITGYLSSSLRGSRRLYSHWLTAFTLFAVHSRLQSLLSSGPRRLNSLRLCSVPTVCKHHGANENSFLMWQIYNKKNCECIIFTSYTAELRQKSDKVQKRGNGCGKLGPGLKRYYSLTEHAGNVKKIRINV
jgi:hypothetical protein